MTEDQKTRQKKAAVIGWPISHSLSPTIHNHWMQAAGIDGSYDKIAVGPEAIETALAQFKAEGYAGFNVTVPHKEAIMPFLDKVAPLARQMGAVNTVKIADDGTMTGFNTDGIGLVTNLKKTVPGWPKDKPVLILGAGGAARAAALGLLMEEVPLVMITNRTRAKAEAIANEIGRGRMTVVDWDDRADAVAAAGLIVNTTVLGMKGQPALEMDLSKAMKDTVVYDIVYQPLMTPLLQDAEARSLRVVTGLGMLVYQAAAAFKIWFGVDVDYDDTLRAELEGQFK
ncbi:shikimate dehydrogenase [Kordiimonas lacus]|uniref:Shikimate dehydrogenase (NADP(+)) n=1 Tax=Kordiimonas lacus TaxID=637679 RepID=A0A1G6TMQ9_9PROT|nr:shikimate dehydrogenase [Kordiimonas lacus]SDD29766.1 shikimate dehydrogenase [Kordiimonas lacus]